MGSENRYKVVAVGRSWILYDPGLISMPDLSLFDGSAQVDRQWHDFDPSRRRSGIGRREVVYFSTGDKNLVLKHYFRGGMVAPVLKDRYLGFSVEKTRAFKEWRLLKRMEVLDLPVPQAVAARVEKKGLYYHCDLITEEIEDVKTLSDALTGNMLEAEIWQSIGSCIKSFHRCGICHADLNARNILLKKDGGVYLIDFDNSRIRMPSDSWKKSNLARLKRSLLKFKGGVAGFNFSDSDWLALLDGYDL